MQDKTDLTHVDSDTSEKIIYTKPTVNTEVVEIEASTPVTTI